MKSMKSMKSLSPMTSMSFKKFSGKRMYVVAFLALVLLGSLWYLSGRNVREGIDDTTDKSTMPPTADKSDAALPNDPEKKDKVPQVDAMMRDMMSKLTQNALPPSA